MKRIVTFLLAAGLLLASACASPAQAPSDSAVPEATGAEAAQEGVYTPGTYVGTAQGFGGTVTATVTVDENSILSIEAEGADETAGVGSKAIEQLPGLVLTAQSAEVEAVTGATVSSTALLSAISSALAEARGESSAAVVMVPGVYTAYATGFSLAEPLEVTVTVSETEILGVEVNADNAETEPVFNAALAITDEIVDRQSLAVDSVTGATLSSNAIRSAATDAVKQAIAAAGGSESSIAAFMTAEEPNTETVRIDTDVVVVGMGASGLSAMTRVAETIAESGRAVNVLAIEKQAYYGGCSLMASDIFAVNPEEHQDAYNGGKDFMDPDVMKRIWAEYTEGDAKQALIDLMIDNSGEVLDWLEFKHGYQFTEQAIQGFSANDTFAGKFQFLPNDNGATNKPAMYSYFTNMVKSYEALGGQYMLNTEGYDLIYDQATNTVQGIKARGNDGTEYEIHASSVILASGGFAGSDEMMSEYLSNAYYPLKGSWMQYGGDNSDGKMIQAAIGIGAGTYNIGMAPIVHLTGVPITLTQFADHVVEDKIGTITNRTAVWSENDVPKYMVIYPYSLAVNKNGERFATEERIGFLDSWKAGPKFYSIWSSDQIEDLKVNGFDAAALTGPSLAWLGYRDAVPSDTITSRDHLMALAMADRYVTCMPDGTPITNIDAILQAGIDAGFIYKANTLAELADVLGIDAATLQNTVETYNQYCANGEDPDFAKSVKYLRALGSGGPYYAVTGCAYCYSTCGGLNVNENLQVLSEDGETPINGLYAVGSDSSGVLYSEKKAYVTYGGAAQGWAYTSGFVCGEIVGAATAAN